MEMLIYSLIAIVLMLIGTIATIKIANSNENKKANPEYDHKTKEYYTRMILIYVILTVLSVAAFLVYIFNRA